MTPPTSANPANALLSLATLVVIAVGCASTPSVATLPSAAPPASSEPPALASSPAPQASAPEPPPPPPPPTPPTPQSEPPPPPDPRLAIPGLTLPVERDGLSTLSCGDVTVTFVGHVARPGFPIGTLRIHRGDKLVLEQLSKDIDVHTADFCLDLDGDGKPEVVLRRSFVGARSRHHVRVVTVDGMVERMKISPGLGGDVMPVHLGKGRAWELLVTAGTLVDSGELVPAFAPFDDLIYAWRGGKYVLAGKSFPSFYAAERKAAVDELATCADDELCLVHTGARVALTAHWMGDWKSVRKRFPATVLKTLDAMGARWARSL